MKTFPFDHSRAEPGTPVMVMATVDAVREGTSIVTVAGHPPMIVENVQLQTIDRSAHFSWGAGDLEFLSPEEVEELDAKESEESTSISDSLHDKKAKALYDHASDNDPIVHSNRFPDWEDLDEESRQVYVRMARR